MIELNRVWVQYANGPTALSDVTLKVSEGEFVFIVGATGAGKSTFLKLLYCEEQASQGELHVLDKDVHKMLGREVPFLRRRMGVVFQDFALLPARTVFENVAYALRVIGARNREIREKVPRALENVGLLKRFDALPDQLSGGEQQRVAIARAIVNDPGLLIADEPTGNLDPDTSLGILDLLIDINMQGTTVIVATHDKTLVDKAGKRVIEFEAGRIIRDDTIGVYDRPMGLAGE